MMAVIWRDNMGAWISLVAATVAAVPMAATAATLRVGPGMPIAGIAEAARQARDGDEVLITPGRYSNCAVWTANRLRIATAGPGPVEIEGPVCQGKALFVISGASVTVEGLTFRGARNESGNGAGIRAEGVGLTIRHSRFLDNQNGILTNSIIPHGVLTIEDSVFIGNGALVGECAHGIYAGRLALVSIRRTHFEATRQCHHVKSRALQTEILDSRIIDGPLGFSSYLVDIPNGGGLRLLRSELSKGPQTGNRTAAIVMGAEGASNPAAPIEIRGNRLTNLLGRTTVFIRNRTTTPAMLADNDLSGPITPLEGPGQTQQSAPAR
jgi:hypothetical protein